MVYTILMLVPYYYPLSWNNYLQAEHIIDGINAKTQKAATAVAAVIHHSISTNARAIIASNEEIALAVDNGFSRLEQRVTGLHSSIDDLRSDFNYGIALLADELALQNSTLEKMSDTLDKISGVVKTPTRTKAREFFVNGCDLFQKGLLDYALKELHRSEQEYTPDFFTQFYLGKLYLYGVNKDVNVIDLKKAEEHFRHATRIGEAYKTKTIAKVTAEAYFHASWTQYLDALNTMGDKPTPKKVLAAVQKLTAAQTLVKKAKEFNPSFLEADYTMAKYASMRAKLMLTFHGSKSVEDKIRMGYKFRQGHNLNEKDKEFIDLGIEVTSAKNVLKYEQKLLEEHFYPLIDDCYQTYLKKAILGDPHYVIKVSLDHDFDEFRDRVDGIIESLTSEKKEEHLNKLVQPKIMAILNVMNVIINPTHLNIQFVNSDTLYHNFVDFRAWEKRINRKYIHCYDQEYKQWFDVHRHFSGKGVCGRTLEQLLLDLEQEQQKPTGKRDLDKLDRSNNDLLRDFLNIYKALVSSDLPYQEIDHLTRFLKREEKFYHDTVSKQKEMNIKFGDRVFALEERIETTKRYLDVLKIPDPMGDYLLNDYFKEFQSCAPVLEMIAAQQKILHKINDFMGDTVQTMEQRVVNACCGLCGEKLSTFNRIFQNEVCLNHR